MEIEIENTMKLTVSKGNKIFSYTKHFQDLYAENYHKGLRNDHFHPNNKKNTEQTEF